MRVGPARVSSGVRLHAALLSSGVRVYAEPLSSGVRVYTALLSSGVRVHAEPLSSGVRVYAALLSSGVRVHAARLSSGVLARGLRSVVAAAAPAGAGGERRWAGRGTIGETPPVCQALAGAQTSTAGSALPPLHPSLSLHLSERHDTYQF